MASQGRGAGADTLRSLTVRQRQLAALYRGEGLTPVTGESPRVAVVGAGLAGLTAAHVLAAGGCALTLYEASGRVGGRIRSERGRCDPRAVWELGGEFIDSDHEEMHALAAVFDIGMLDTLPPSEDTFATAYRFGGQAYSEAQVEAAFAEIAPRIATDLTSISARPGYRAPSEADRRFDRLSIAEYLDGLKLDRWLHELIEVAYVTVYGLDPGEQSALNLLMLIGTGTARGFGLFGHSDERYKIRAGSQQLTDALARGLGARIAFERRLVRLRRSANDWVLSFDGGAEARADAVILALPFTLLRQVDLGDLLPPAKRLAVNTLGYGTNSKLMLGTRRRVWREQGFNGGSYTDGALQTSWDCSRLRGGAGGVFTVFLGGRLGVALGDGDEAAQAAHHAMLAEAIFPGLGADCTGEARRIHWPSEPFALGAYACYRPGQWTAFGGAEAEPLPGGLYFAGEHCAGTSQGYMNGAAETGRKAALAILYGLTK
jgi:monoamine oxidase